MPCAFALLIGCGKKTPEPTEAVQTPGMKAAGEAYDEGRYADAAKLYTAELAAEKSKLEPSWEQLTSINTFLGVALNSGGQYDKTVAHYQKALAIMLKQLGPDHPDVAASYINMALVYKAKEYWEKAYAIRLKRLGPNHPDTKAKLDALKE